jgi:hypothetical protein
MMNDVPTDFEQTAFAKADTVGCNDCFDQEFAELDNSLTEFLYSDDQHKVEIVYENDSYAVELHPDAPKSYWVIDKTITNPVHPEETFYDKERAIRFVDMLVADIEIANRPQIREGVTDSTRALKGSDFVIVSKHPNRGTYSFLGNNYRMTRNLDKAMPYATKEEAEYDLQVAEDQSDVPGSNYDRYTSKQFFVATVREARQLLDTANWRNAKQLSIADMTIESLVEAMEENEDTVECKVCEELYEKAKCHKDPTVGWVCENCDSTLLTERYVFNNFARIPDAKEQIILTAIASHPELAEFLDDLDFTIKKPARASLVRGAFAGVGNVTDFTVDGDIINVTLVRDPSRPAGQQLELDTLMNGGFFPSGLNRTCPAYKVLSAIRDAAREVNRRAAPGRAERAAERHVSNVEAVLATLRGNAEAANELRDHITNMVFEVPLSDTYEFDLDGEDPDYENACTRIERLQTRFETDISAEFRDILANNGLIKDRSLAGIKLWHIVQKWGLNCVLSFDCEIGELEARGLIEDAQITSKVTDKRIDLTHATSVNCYMLAVALIRYFNDPLFFRTVDVGAGVVDEPLSEAAASNTYPNELNRYCTFTYDNMTVPVVTRVIPATLEDPEDYEEEYFTKTFEYEVFLDDVATVIFENFMTDADAAQVPGGMDALATDEELWLTFLKNNFDTLFDKYYDQLLAYFEDDATEAAREQFQTDYDEYEPDEDRAYDEWRDRELFGESLEESDEEFYSRLTMCPECGAEKSFDHKACRCIECKFGSLD